MTKLLALLCVLGLLGGAKLISDGRLMLRTTELARHHAQTGELNTLDKSLPMGETLMVVGLTLAAKVNPQALEDAASEARKTTWQGYLLAAGALLGLAALAVRRRLKAKNTSALALARSRRRGGS